MNWVKIKKESDVKIDGYQVLIESKEGDHTDVTILKNGEYIFKVKKLDYGMQVLIPEPPKKVKAYVVTWNISGQNYLKNFRTYSEADKFCTQLSSEHKIEAFIDDSAEVLEQEFGDATPF